MKCLRDRVESELLDNILRFWLEHAPDGQYGGFRGRISNDLVVDAHAPKGLILNARILWTFSKACKVYGNGSYLETARRAYEYLTRCFWDCESGGLYWLVDYRGRPVDTKKRIYGQAFAVYALAEYYLASQDSDALQRAIDVQGAIERSARDTEHKGYFETYERDWTLAREQRLSEVDLDEKKSMNTHLHILEAYARLLGAWDDRVLRERLEEVIRLFLERIINPDTHHFRLFFDEEWNPKSNRISFGHDIEGSWLLCEAAEAAGDRDLLERVRAEAVRMARAVLEEAVDSDGGLLYEADPGGITDGDKHWWPQAEAVVGFLNAYQVSGQRDFVTAAYRTWDFIENYIVDRRHGEWFWKVSRAGIPSSDKLKVDMWKCPYHNSRACWETMARLDALPVLQNPGGRTGQASPVP